MRSNFTTAILKFQSKKPIKKKYLIYLLSGLIIYSTYAQDKIEKAIQVNPISCSIIDTTDCEQYYKAYCDSLKKGNIIPVMFQAYYVLGDIHKRFYENNPSIDYNRKSIDSCIYDLDAFCKGVREGLKSNSLILRMGGDINHSPPCYDYSYEKYGVSLYMTGDIALPSQPDENAGFNFIMHQKIRRTIGEESFKLLGKVDANWIIDGDILFEFHKFADIRSNTDTTAFIKLDLIKLQKSKIKTLEGVRFKDILNDKLFSLQDLIKGIEIKVKKEKFKKGKLRLYFENYKNPNFCKPREGYLDMPIII